MAKRRTGLNSISVTDTGTMDPFDLAALTEGIDELYRNISNENIRTGSLSADRLKMKKHTDIVLSDSATTNIPHGLGVTPKLIIVVPKGSTRWWQTKEPDQNYIYLQSLVADIKHDIVVIG